MPAVIPAVVTAAGAGYQAYSASKSAKEQQEQWRDIAEPQEAYMKAMLPFQEEIMREYTMPYIRETYPEERRIAMQYGFPAQEAIGQQFFGQQLPLQQQLGRYMMTQLGLPYYYQGQQPPEYIGGEPTAQTTYAPSATPIYGPITAAQTAIPPQGIPPDIWATLSPKERNMFSAGGYAPTPEAPVATPEVAYHPETSYTPRADMPAPYIPLPYYPETPYLPKYEEEYPSEDVWARTMERISAPYEQVKQEIGERAAGAGTLRGGPTQALLAKTDIAKAEDIRKAAIDQALAEIERGKYAYETEMQRIPWMYQAEVGRYGARETAEQQRLRNIMTYLGMQQAIPAPTGPTVPSMTMPGIPAMSGVPETDYGQWGQMGSLLSSLFQKTPVVDPIGAYNVGYGPGYYPGGYSDIAW